MNYIFFHKRDLDGHCSGAIARLWHEQNHQNFQMVPIDYGDPFEYTFVPEDTVYFLDWTLQPAERTLALAKTCNLIIIDHHKTSGAYVGLNGFIVPDNSLAGCQLAAKWFYEASYPFVDLLGTYDTWKVGANWDSEVLPFQYGMRTKDSEPITDSAMFMWKQLFHAAPDILAHKINEIIGLGHAILAYERKKNVEKMKNAFEFTFEGLRVLAYVTTAPGSQQFDSRYDESRHDLMMPITNVENKYWSVSMYTTKDIDLSVLAKKWGGGGHAKACGFQVTDFYDLFRLR